MGLNAPPPPTRTTSLSVPTPTQLVERCLLHFSANSHHEDRIQNVFGSILPTFHVCGPSWHASIMATFVVGHRQIFFLFRANGHFRPRTREAL